MMVGIREDLFIRGGGRIGLFRRPAGRGGQVVIARLIDRAAGRRPARRRFFPEVQVSQNGAYVNRVFDHRNLGHFPAALRTA